MSSSPITLARRQPPNRPDLLTLFGSVPDPRHRRGVRHTLPVILALGVAAVLTGARSFAAIGEWVADQPCPALARLGVPAGPRPTESTIRRVFARLDADLLDQVIGAFLWTRTRVGDGRRIIAIDGKTVRGARTAHGLAPAPGRGVRPRSGPGRRRVRSTPLAPTGRCERQQCPVGAIRRNGDYANLGSMTPRTAYRHFQASRRVARIPWARDP